MTLTPNGKELKKYKFYWYYVCGNKPLLCSCVGLILDYHSFLDFLALQISCSSNAFHNFKLTGRSAVFSMVVLCFLVFIVDILHWVFSFFESMYDFMVPSWILVRLGLAITTKY